MAQRPVGFSPPPADGSDTATWSCSRCGNLNPSSQPTCLRCGEDVETASVREREIDGITIAARDFETLRFAPLWVFYAVAGADDKVDKKEFRALAEMLNNSQFFTDRFVREIFGSLARNFAEIMPAFMADERPPEKAFEDVRSALDRTLSDEQAKLFKLSLLTWAGEVAQASGGFLGMGNRTGQDERMAFAAIATTLGLAPADLQ